MSYTQLVTPNLDPYIYVKGAPLSDWCGWCMGYVSSAFQVFGADSAHIGWTKSQSQHPDKTFPSGVFVPIWFDWYGNIDGTGVKNWGHVAIYKDGKVWSSPLTHKPSADVYQSFDAFVTAFTAAGVAIKYVGWSEDLLGTKLIQLEGDDMSTVGEVEFHDLYEGFFGPMTVNPPSQDDRKRWVGAETNTVLRAMQDDPRHAAWLQYIDDLKKAGANASSVVTRDSVIKYVNDNLK